jgi:signal transduction histidine kinase
MSRRLLLVLMPLFAALLVALGLPLAGIVAQRETQATYLDRLADSERFVALAEVALRSERTGMLEAEVRRYEELYGIAVAIVAPNGDPLLSSRSAPDLDSPAVKAGLTTAFAGFRADRIRTVWPWQRDPLVIVDPVGRDSAVIAAVVTVSPTDRLRSGVLRRWLLLGGLGVVPLLLAAFVAVPVSRWVLRPVRDLDEASTAIGAGRLEARARPLRGPPELRRMVSSFNDMADVVVRTLGRQRTFVSDASHQLRNPLLSLRLAVDNLAPYVAAGGREIHDDAVHEAEEMGRILDSLLALTRVESASTAPAPLALATAVEGHVPAWQATLKRAGMALAVEVPPDVWVVAPGDGLGHVLDELVGNAARLSGGSRVDVVATVDERTVDLHVRDDGAGLDAAEREQAVERFWRGREQQNVAGTGLGLAICREVVEAAGGQLDLLAASPRGLDVRIRLAKAEPSPV